MKRLVPHWDYLSWARDRFGVLFALASYVRVLLGLHARIPIKDGKGVYLRPGTTDLAVFDEVFRSREYEIDLDEPRVVVDAGAHIGLATVFFAMRYPKARIIAVELDPGNFRMLQKNLRGLSNVMAVHAGLWSHNTRLQVSNPSADTWSYRAAEGGEIHALTVSDILTNYGLDRIDLLKIDIEGGEKAVLEHAEHWIHKVGAIVIETHDRYVAGCTEVLERAIAGQGFRRSMSGESVVLVR